MPPTSASATRQNLCCRQITATTFEPSPRTSRINLVPESQQGLSNRQHWWLHIPGVENRKFEGVFAHDRWGALWGWAEGEPEKHYGQNPLVLAVCAHCLHLTVSAFFSIYSVVTPTASFLFFWSTTQNFVNRITVDSKILEQLSSNFWHNQIIE